MTVISRQVGIHITVVITQLCLPNPSACHLPSLRPSANPPPTTQPSLFSSPLPPSLWSCCALPPVLLSAVVYPGEVARHVGAAVLDGDVAAALRLPAWQSVLEQYERAFDGPEDPTDPGLPLLRLESVLEQYKRAFDMPEYPTDPGLPLLRLELSRGGGGHSSIVQSRPYAAAGDTYFAVGGGIAAQFRAARMPLLGYLLLLWGLLRPILLPHTYPDPSKVASRHRGNSGLFKVQPPSIQPAFLIGLLLAFLCLPGEGGSSKKILKQATIKAGSDAAKAEKKTN
ncbi:unnamed protein product [Closterium sp. Naga37s-1]|nr:unnamed protein product [Closterium sp. Naga37s-1]